MTLRTRLRAALQAVLLATLLAAPAAAQTTSIGISGLPIATAANPQTDYALGIVQQLNPAGVPFFVTAKVPLGKLVGPPGTPAYITGVNVTTLPPGAAATGFIGGGSPNYVLNLGIPAGLNGNATASGSFTPGDFVLSAGAPQNAGGIGLVDGGKPAAVATSGSASDLGAGTLPAARLPASGVTAGSAVLPSLTVDTYGRITALSQAALTGDVTTSAGSLATTISAGAVTNTDLANMPPGTIKGKVGAAAGPPSDLTPSQAKTLLGYASSGANSDITSVQLGAATSAGATSPGKSIGTLAAGSSNFAAVAPGTAQGQAVGLDFWPTFQGQTDNGPRRAASIRGRFAGGIWGTETLDFLVGSNSAANDAANVPTLVFALSGSGASPAPLPLNQGGTGSTTAAAGRQNLGAAASGANTDITSLAAPALGSATATTQAAGDNSAKVATDFFVANAIAAVGGGGAPSAVVTTTSGTTQVAAAADKGKTYLLSGSSTLQLPPAVQIAGWYAWVKKSDGNGVWAITPTSSGTAPAIDGLASINCYQESYLVWWDSANSVFRTQDRPKGWINIGSTPISTAVAAANFTVGFADPELRDMMFDAENIVFASSDQVGMRLQKSGSYQTSGYVAFASYWGAAVGNTQPSAYVYLTGGTSTSPMSATATIYSFSLNNGVQRIESTSLGNSYATIAQSYQSTVAPITGVQFFGDANGANLTGGTVNQRGFRP